MSSIRKRYKLSDIKALVRANMVKINRDAAEDAWNFFGWGENDIKTAFLKLSEGFYYKTEIHDRFYPITMDYYKARNFMKVDLYLHFYVRDGWLIVSSCKPI